MSPSPADRLPAALRRHGLVAILRARTPGAPLLDVVRTLVDAGVAIIEITVPTPGSLEAVRAAAAQYGDRVLIGTGTVTTPAQVRATAEAGGAFVVSPHTDPELIRAARDAGLGALPGAFTPTEILAAHRAGATAVKLFPATGLGPGYVADVRAPLPDIPLVPTGGVGTREIPAYRAAGAVAVGVGSPLVGDALAGGSLAALGERAAEFVRLAAEGAAA
ncbi:bifunctional 4-hydroxy-2-oxoglutarate aldolase/2-dehydro-3-deoxy-phosphogluconate aldolase [Streptomyces sp. RFCAC02]|uniref:bifunctional 4-hydroxy-2-oxoglutarate aldolase/2-dehydro-3-deoxy-phosphogluconate aldolase n=1 Tax=Streptomyces sp. RFCAC02 TaxID=2499143 RepID=UPI00101F87A0|nr:bifunctional 4-hydroxy-2-oxoglutarate aldolase/2-dehydro-3-deoxy-phosphogluconate aldolase [Streptomyces sp. RFCAC02]